MTSVQVPWTFIPLAGGAKTVAAILRIVGREERGTAVLDRRGRVVVEDRVVKIGRVDALAHAAEEGDLALSVVRHVVV